MRVNPPISTLCSYYNSSNKFGAFNIKDRFIWCQLSAKILLNEMDFLSN